MAGRTLVAGCSLGAERPSYQSSRRRHPSRHLPAALMDKASLGCLSATPINISTQLSTVEKTSPPARSSNAVAYIRVRVRHSDVCLDFNCSLVAGLRNFQPSSSSATWSSAHSRVPLRCPVARANILGGPASDSDSPFCDFSVATRSRLRHSWSLGASGYSAMGHGIIRTSSLDSKAGLCQTELFAHNQGHGSNTGVLRQKQ